MPSVRIQTFSDQQLPSMQAELDVHGQHASAWSNASGLLRALCSLFRRPQLCLQRASHETANVRQYRGQSRARLWILVKAPLQYVVQVWVYLWNRAVGARSSRLCLDSLRSPHAGIGRLPCTGHEQGAGCLYKPSMAQTAAATVSQTSARSQCHMAIDRKLH
jgi:hypothetical protein